MSSLRTRNFGNFGWLALAAFALCAAQPSALNRVFFYPCPRTGKGAHCTGTNAEFRVPITPRTDNMGAPGRTGTQPTEGPLASAPRTSLER
ncbi:Hypothetical predicted protein [Cloeon dipterum]|uniref:Secreted protein n=1 Tax=Cloeon dipterum TaxID=197152 RepID=A0A8S1E1A1_9INSE|nr:Hypothetical predicted protein [Cloeon dipterum]